MRADTKERRNFTLGNEMLFFSSAIIRNPVTFLLESKIPVILSYSSKVIENINNKNFTKYNSYIRHFLRAIRNNFIKKITDVLNFIS